MKETILVPKLAADDPPAVLHHIEVTNLSDTDASILATVYADMQGDVGPDLLVEFDDELGALIVRNHSEPNAARIIGAEGCEVGYRTTHDVSEGYAGTHARRLDTSSQLTAAPIGELQLDLEIKAGRTAEATIVAVVSHLGVERR